MYRGVHRVVPSCQPRALYRVAQCCFALRVVPSRMSSISDSDIIKKHPIGQQLDSFRSVLKSRCEEAGIADNVTGSDRMARLAETSTSGWSMFQSQMDDGLI